MIKLYLTAIFLFTCLSFKGQNRGTIHVKRNEGMVLKSCICGKTDTVFISRKKLFNDSTTLDICNGKKIIPYKVLSFGAYLLDNNPNPLPNASISFRNKFGYGGGNRKRQLLIEVSRWPPFTTIIVRNVIFGTEQGKIELHSSGNLIVVLTD